MFPRIFLLYTDGERRAEVNSPFEDELWNEGQFEICYLTFLICHLELRGAFQALDVQDFVDLNGK
jgi:hypothetical protein